MFLFQLSMVDGLIGVSVLMAFRRGSVTVLFQRMVEFHVLTPLEDHVLQKLLQHRNARVSHVSYMVMQMKLTIVHVAPCVLHGMN